MNVIIPKSLKLNKKRKRKWKNCNKFVRQEKNTKA